MKMAAVLSSEALVYTYGHTRCQSSEDYLLKYMTPLVSCVTFVLHRNTWTVGSYNFLIIGDSNVFTFRISTDNLQD